MNSEFGMDYENFKEVLGHCLGETIRIRPKDESSPLRVNYYTIPLK